MSDQLYHERILKLAATGSGLSVLDSPDGTARVDNPLCGDRVDAQVTLDGDEIKAASFRVRGCRLCEASAALIAEQVPTQSIDTWLKMAEGLDALVRDAAPCPAEWPDAKIFEPVHDHKSRHDCPLLPAQALTKAIKNAQSAPSD